MANSTTPVVVAILMAGVIIGGAILLSRPKPADPPKPDQYQELKAGVAVNLSDPGSATFQALSEEITGIAYCGEVNAKNRMGGYVGYRKFYAMRGVDGQWIVDIGGPIAAKMCK